MKKVIMVNDKDFVSGYSIEAGKSDSKYHFDHHGEFSGHVAPCIANIPVADDDAVIQISHLDADTLIGVLKLFGVSLPEVDYSLMEQIDLNGSSVCKNKFDCTLLYMVGVGEIARAIKFPRATDKAQDVTGLIKEMISIPHEEVIETGRKATQQSETVYRDYKVAQNGCVGLWSINADQPLDPSRPYEDGVSIVVVYRQHYKSVSVYCDPSSDFTAMALGKVEVGEMPLNYWATIGGYRMCGHPKATGTERNEAGWQMDDAQAIYRSITSLLIKEGKAWEDGMYIGECPRCGECEFSYKEHSESGYCVACGWSQDPRLLPSYAGAKK